MLLSIAVPAAIMGITRTQPRQIGFTKIIRENLLSSLFFAAVHASQAFSGEGFVSVTLAVVNAMIFGIVSAEIVVLTESLIPVIIWHFLFNLLNWLSIAQGNRGFWLIVVQTIVLIPYGLYLWIKLPLDKASRNS